MVHGRPCLALSRPVQLTTDGLKAYPDAVEKAFGCDVDYAVLNKTYEGGPMVVEAKRRYSPNVCIGATKIVINGPPEVKMISITRRAREPDHAYGNAPVHAADERIQQEDAKCICMRSACTSCTTTSLAFISR